MDHFAVSEFAVLILALLGVSLIFRLENSLPLVIGLLLIAATATVAVLRNGIFKGGLAEMHGLYSSLSASVGMMMIVLSFMSFKLPNLLQGGRQGLIIIVATALFAAAGIFQFVGPLVTIATIAAIFSTIAAGCVLINIQQYQVGFFTAATGILFLILGSTVGSHGPDLFDLLPRWHVFYLTLAFWSLSAALSFRSLTLLSNKEQAAQ